MCGGTVGVRRLLAWAILAAATAFDLVPRSVTLGREVEIDGIVECVSGCADDDSLTLRTDDLSGEPESVRIHTNGMRDRFPPLETGQWISLPVELGEDGSLLAVG